MFAGGCFTAVIVSTCLTAIISAGTDLIAVIVSTCLITVMLIPMPKTSWVGLGEALIEADGESDGDALALGETEALGL